MCSPIGGNRLYHFSFNFRSVIVPSKRVYSDIHFVCRTDSALKFGWFFLSYVVNTTFSFWFFF